MIAYSVGLAFAQFGLFTQSSSIHVEQYIVRVFGFVFWRSQILLVLIGSLVKDLVVLIGNLGFMFMLIFFPII